MIYRKIELHISSWQILSFFVNIRINIRDLVEYSADEGDLFGCSGCREKYMAQECNDHRNKASKQQCHSLVIRRRDLDQIHRPR